MLLGLMLFAPHGLYGALRQGWRRFMPPRPQPPEELTERAEHPPISGLALEISGLSKRFGGVLALDNVDFSAPAGSCCAIVGPNGSGKTTLLNLASGYYSADSGSVKIGGVETLGTKAQRIAARGVGRTFQTPRLVASLTALDNVMLGAYTRERAGLLSTALRLPFARREARELRLEALGFLHFVGVADRAETEAGETPHGQQRLIEIARAMMGGARLILLDEPAAGLSMAELERLERLIRRICELGATIIIVEHHLDLVANIASHVTVLDRGVVLASGKPATVFNDEQVMRAYMGERALKVGVPA
jgi:ABC-type branched-subunit amino acid transport system ATPase component